MTLEEKLDEAGVKTLEELEAKIRNEAEASSVKENESLKEQVKNLEMIKASQGNKVGDALKAKEAAEAKLEELKESTQAKKGEKENRATEKSDDDWRQENSKREKAFSDEDFETVDAALKDAPAEVKDLVKTEEGRAAFYDKVLGSKESTVSLETFRRLKQKKKLSVAEQMDEWLDKNKSQKSTPTAQSSGIRASNVNQNQKQPSEISNGDGWDHLQSLYK